jgi:RES domain-containing protein
MTRRSRSLAAIATLFCVLFAQWAVAHHSAQGLIMHVKLATAPAVEMAAEMAADMASADEMDCHRAAASSATFSKMMCKQHFDAAEFSAFVVAFVVPAAVADLVLVGAHPIIAADLVPRPPPLSRNANLRI